MKPKHMRMTLVCALILILGVCSTSWAAPAKGGQVGNLKFAAPISDEDAAYLGLSKPGEFTLQDVKAPYVLIEIMRTTCPHCTEQASALNELYRLVQSSELKNKVKFIAVGESNNAAALKRFKTAYKVPFAMVPDPDWTIGDIFHIAGTPTTVVLNKSGRVIMVEEGAFPNAQQVFKKLQARLQ